MPGVARTPWGHKELDTTEVTERARMNIQAHTALFKIGNQQGPTARQRQLCSVLRGSLDRREFAGEWIMYMYGWVHLCCPPETIITLLVGYSQI